MINVAGREDCDEYIKKELKEAGINYNEYGVTRNGEVPSKCFAHFQGWVFERAWCYWIAKTDTTPLLFRFADELHETHGKEVRVDGHCGCPAPREWHKKPWDIGVNCYHIDSQEGLNAFVKMVQKQTELNSSL